MKKKKFIVIISYFFIIGILVFIYMGYLMYENTRYASDVEADKIFGIVVPRDENEGFYYDLKGYNKDGGYILFVPSRTNISKLTYYSVDENGKRNARYTHDFSTGADLIAGQIPVVLMQSNIPSIEISLHGKSLDEIDASPRHEVSAAADVVISCTDSLAAERGFEAISRSKGGRNSGPGSARLKGRGNNTWEMDKKGYSVTLKKSQNLLNLGETDKWVLLANAQDYSLLRNQFFLNLSAECGVKYSGNTEPVDLFVDGEYRGNYVLAKKVEISAASVDIDPKKGYLFRWGMPTDYALKLETDAFRHDDSKVVEVLGKVSEQEKSKAFAIAQRFISEIENTASNEFTADMDMESFALYYWIQELSKNTDSTSRSFYTVWDSDTEKMYACPVWDMDRTVGVIEPFERPVEYLYPTGYAVRGEEWFVPLFKHPEFVAEVERVYKAYGLADKFRNAVSNIPAQAEYIRASANMNFMRWDVLEVEQNNAIVKWMGESTYDTQVEWVRAWLEQRIDFFENPEMD